MEAILIGDAKREIVLSRKPIRHLYVRLKEDGKLHVSAPLKMTEAAIVRFLIDKSALLEERLQRRPRPNTVSKDQAYWFGRILPVSVTLGTMAYADDTAVYLPFRADQESALKRLYRQAVVAKTEQLWLKWQHVLPAGVFAGWKFASSDTRSVYGTCSMKTKTIRLSSLLGRLDEIHLETILVHELTHLLVAGHGSDFYRVLLAWMPDYKKRHRALVAAHRNIEV